MSIFQVFISKLDFAEIINLSQSFVIFMKNIRVMYIFLHICAGHLGVSNNCKVNILIINENKMLKPCF